MAGRVDRERSSESPTGVADAVRERRRVRTRRRVTSGLAHVGAGALLIVGAGIIAGLGAPWIGLGALVAGTFVGAYGMGKSIAGVGSGIYNTVRV